MKRLFYILAALLLCALLCSCSAFSGDEAEETAERFLSLLNEGEYELAYDLLSTNAQEEITREDFSKKYDSIFHGLGVKSLIPGESTLSHTPLYATYQYSATYRTADYGDITKDYTMNLVQQDDRWVIDWTPALIFPEMTWGDSVYASVIQAKRGEIFSADGQLLASNVAGTTVYADRSAIEDIDSYCTRIAPMLGMETEAVKKCFDSTTANIVTLKAWPQGQLSQEGQKTLLEIPGTGIDNSRFTVFRTYPFGEAFFHLIGYTGKITKEDLESFAGTEKEPLYNGDSIIGRTGLEAAYEDTLRGTNGYEVYIYSEENGKIPLTDPVEAVDGADLHLTIDARVQQAAYDMLCLYLREEQGGSIIQIDPKTSALEVMVSYPSVDPNLFVQGISTELYAQLNEDVAYQPLFNRCIQGLYPPGSILKPFTGLAGLEAGIISENTVFPYQIVDNKWRPDRSDWYYPAITRVKNRGDKCDLYNSIIYSDNIYFAWVAMELGEEAFFDYFENKLGFGQKVPFDLSVAVSRLKNAKTEFNIKLLADSGYGQGEVLISPLQAALLYCSLSNEGGEIYQPYVVDSLWRSEGRDYVCVEETEPVLWMTVKHDKNARSAIEKSLEDVTKVGTARSLKPPYEMAGKTGTAEIGAQKDREIGWLAVYKDEEPRDMVLTITLDVPTDYGSLKLNVGHYLMEAEEEIKAADAKTFARSGETGAENPMTAGKPAEPEQETEKGYVTADRLKVRAQPSTESEEVGRLRQNSEVEILGQEGDWYQIRRDEVTGYVLKEYIGGAPVEN